MSDLWRRRRAPLALAALLALLLAGCSGDPLGVLPESASPEADEVDHLIYLIIYVTGVTFVGVQGLFVWFLIRHRRKEGVRATHTHGNHSVELVWTIAPALILVLLAVYQADLWMRVKSKRPEDLDPSRVGSPVELQIFARQFEWHFRYPGPDGEFDAIDADGKLPQDTDDRVMVGALVVPKDRVVLAEMRSMDVLHSFFLPHFRFKQDAVPGLQTKIWFRSNKLSADRQPVTDMHGEIQHDDWWDIVCAELCGNGHTTMAGRLYVVSNEDYEAWRQGEPTTVTVPGVSEYGPEGANLNEVWRRWNWQDENVPTGRPRWTREPFGEDDLGEDAVSEDEEDDF